jgi:hypothetical protein
VGVRDTPEYYSAKRVIYWSSTDDAGWILRSRHCAQNLVMLNSSVTRSGPYPFDGDFPKFMHEVETLAMPAYVGIAKYLLSLPRREAAKAISSEPMEPAERSKIAANASGEDVRTLQQMFSTQAPKSVDWCGVAVSETPNGWVCKNRVISSVKFYIDEMRPFNTGSDAMLIGSVVYGNRSVAFQEKLSVLKRNTAAWLENFAVQKFGVIAHIERSWRHRLLDISQTFRQPNAIMPGQRYGWNERVLRMPLFIVDNKDISPSYEIIDGPRMPLPSIFTEAEKDAFDSESFCRLFLVMLKNMLQTAEGPGSGWVIVNQPTVIERAAYAFCIDAQHDPADAVLQAQRSDPIMRPTVLSGSHSRVLEQGPSANILVSLDRLTASLAYIFHGWPVLTIKEAVEYRCLRGVFVALQALLAQPKAVKHYREIASVVSECFGTKGALYAAGLELDRAYNVRDQSVAVKLTVFLVELSNEKLLPITATDDGVRVLYADFYAAIAGASVSVPEPKEISHVLAGVKFLVDSTDTAWVFRTDAWHFHNRMLLTHQTAS